MAHFEITDQTPIVISTRTAMLEPLEIDPTVPAYSPNWPFRPSFTRAGRVYPQEATDNARGTGPLRHLTAADVGSPELHARATSGVTTLIPPFAMVSNFGANPVTDDLPRDQSGRVKGVHIPSRFDYEVMDHADDRVAESEDMGQWLFERRLPSVPEGSSDHFYPTLDSPEFFSKDFEQTTNGALPNRLIENSLEGPVTPPTTPIMIIPPPPAGFLAPRAPKPFPSISPEILNQPHPDLWKEAMQWATNAVADNPQIETSRSICTEPACPIADAFHLEGRYVHNDTPTTNHLETFGQSNPPPNVWQAVHNGCRWVGTQQDADLISRFIEYHGMGGNFFIAPHTNFLWGEEVNTPQAVLGAPIVRLPFPATPLRIDFDASLNLPSNSNPSDAYMHGVLDGPSFHRCIDTICPIMDEHGQGMYLHNNLPPRIKSVAFGYSNPPDYIWAALDRITAAQLYNLKASNADHWAVTNFQKLHVSGTNSGFLLQ